MRLMSVARLASEISGRLIAPGDAEYETARRVWNGMIDKRPAAIARCAGVDDVTSAIGFAAAERLPVAVRGGAHNIAGNATCDEGLVIDLAGLKRIEVDRGARPGRAGGARLRQRPHRARNPKPSSRRCGRSGRRCWMTSSRGPMSISSASSSPPSRPVGSTTGRQSFEHRKPAFSLLILSGWVSPADTDANVAWTRNLFELASALSSPAVYVNYLGVEGDQRVRDAFGANHERLAQVKRRYDPSNHFRLNQNIEPASDA